MSDLTERLRSKRSCTVCEGDGIKSNGKECGGCKGSGEVYRHDRTGPEAADEIDRLTRELAEAREALRMVEVPSFKQSMTYTGKDGWSGRVTFSFNSIEEVQLFISKLADAERLLKEGGK